VNNITVNYKKMQNIKKITAHKNFQLEEDLFAWSRNVFAGHSRFNRHRYCHK